MGLMAAPSLVPRVNLDLQKTGKHHETPGLPEHLRYIQGLRVKRTLAQAQLKRPHTWWDTGLRVCSQLVVPVGARAACLEGFKFLTTTNSQRHAQVLPQPPLPQTAPVFEHSGQQTRAMEPRPPPQVAGR